MDKVSKKSMAPDAKKHAKASPKPQAEALLAAHSSFVVGDLPADMKAIYSRTVKQLLPAIQKKIPVPDIIEEADGATLVFEVDSKEIAEQMFRRLQNTTVFGSKWKLEYHPLSAVTCANEASLVDIVLNPPASKYDVAKALAGVQGFLAVDEPLGLTSTGETGIAAGQKSVAADGEAVVTKLVATFADEGGAVHARAVLSGRRVGPQGSRMFLSLRRK